MDRRTLLRGAGGFATLSGLTLSGITLSGLALSGCARGAGSKQLEQPKTEVPAKFSGRTAIVVWHAYGGANGTAMAEVVRRFNASQEDVYVDQQYQGSYDELSAKTTAALQSGKAPDMVIDADHGYGVRLLADQLEELDGYLADGFLDAYNDAVIKDGLIDRHLYWLPFAKSTPIMYVNRDLLQRARLPDRGPKTWTELREWGRELRGLRVHGKPARAHVMAPGRWPFQARVLEFGGQLSDGLKVRLDTDTVIDCAEWFRRLIVTDKAAYTSSDATTDFTNGLAATYVSSTAGLRGIVEAARFDVGVSFLPKQESTGMPTGGSGAFLFKRVPDERKQAAGAFMRFLGTPATSAFWSLRTGYLPTVEKAVKEKSYAKKLANDPRYDVAIKQLPKAVPTSELVFFLPSGGIDIDKALERILSAGQRARPVLTDLATKLRRDVRKVRPDYDRYFG